MEVFGDFDQPFDRSHDPRREPGPINLRRYNFVPAYAGHRHVLRRPAVPQPGGLAGRKVDVAIVGAPVDTSWAIGGGVRPACVARRRTVAAEHARAADQPEHPDSAPFEHLTVVDYGDAAVDPLSIENSMQPIRTLVREIAEVGAVPIVLGGDHSILWPDAAAVADVYGGGNVGVIHFDAHPDCADTLVGHPVSHGTPIRRLIDDEHVPARNFIQIGLRSAVSPDEALFEWMNENGLRAHYMAEIDRRGFDAVLEDAIAEALDGPQYLFLSLDIDVLDPAFAPGTGTPEPPGLTNRELLPALRRICHETPVVGIEVVEVAPHLDPGYTTTMNARRAIFECLSGLAMRRAGFPGPAYLHPDVAGPPDG